MTIDPVDITLQAALRGDAEAFGSMIRRLDPEMRAVAWSVLRSDRHLEDVLQSAYEKAFRSVGSFRQDAQFSTWLHSIVYRTALDSIRRERYRTHDNIDHTAHPATTSPDLHSSVHAKLEVAELLDQLRPEERTSLMLVYGFGYHYDEVALIQDEAKGTISSRLSRLRQRLGQAGIETHE